MRRVSVACLSTTRPRVSPPSLRDLALTLHHPVCSLSLRRKAARKAAVRAAAEASAASGRGETAFTAPEYGLSEESKTPNFHTRQEEGIRKSGGA